MSPEPEGYKVPIHRSLTEPIMIMGVPRTLAMLNGTLAAALVIGLQSWYGIPICLLVHVISYRASKTDPMFFDILMRHTKEKDCYYN